jgi:hypothetical protein
MPIHIINLAKDCQSELEDRCTQNNSSPTSFCPLSFVFTLSDGLSALLVCIAWFVGDNIKKGRMRRLKQLKTYMIAPITNGSKGSP